MLVDVSKLWDKLDRDHVLVRDDQGMIFCIFCLCYILFVAVMFALHFIKSDDTSNVVFGDSEATSEKMLLLGALNIGSRVQAM